MLKSKLSKLFDKSKNTEIRLLILVFLIALFFRLYGIKHGFPLITHPDEPSVIRSALGLRFELNPKHFDWPHMYFYINYIVFTLFIKFRGLLLLLFSEKALNNVFPLLNRDPLVFYYISRVLTAIFGSLTVFPVYGVAKELFNKKTAIFSALVFALIPFHIRHSHYALIDVPMTFWVAMSLYFAARIYNSPKLSNYIFAGLTIGFAASTKYNGGLLAFVVFLAHIFRIYRSNSTSGLGQKVLIVFGFGKGEKVFALNEIKPLLLSAISAVMGFFIGTPFALFDYATFSRTDGPQGAYWQFTNVGKVPFLIQLQQLFDGVLFKLPDDLGYTFLIIFFIVLVLFIFKSLRNHRFFIDNLSLALILFPAVFILFYISGFEKARSHYYMPMYPYMAIAVGFGLSFLNSYFYSKDAKKFFGSKYKLFYYALLFVILIIPAFIGLKTDYVLSRGGTRNELNLWLEENASPKDLLLYNSSSLLPVLNRFSENEVTKDPSYENIKDRHGYLLIYFDEKDYEHLFSDSDPYMNLVLEKDLEFIEWIVPHLQSGSNILIYRF